MNEYIVTLDNGDIVTRHADNPADICNDFRRIGREAVAEIEDEYGRIDVYSLGAR